MKRIIIVVEGQTEQEFIKQCLAPYLADRFGILSTSARLIGTPGHKRGYVSYKRLQKDATILLRESNTLVSTFIDYFKLESDFPDFDQAQRITDVDKRITFLEQAINSQLNSERFIPYIQKHEFEALLFSGTQQFKTYLSQASCAALAEISQQYADPELINDKNPPSYRLIEIFKQHEPNHYNKVVFGNILALETGIETMLARCPRFSTWISRLASAAQIHP